ncbi:AcrR family transcriptional regulator [Diaminobutyricimonas aerilata]|uniref:AcrR family transcriptional regulator n=1 Tax=Diaminobutyricimonas aerilata TaxID=1162967 RepID=A0A2M9CNE6_9MICO|nr:TetR family transcriptional regulator [Diaminobutyricimonas aerilata]PJJ73433.1 AcrR family transcriptional regulator [Diaminobutyricimonas aerilata]
MHYVTNSATPSTREQRREKTAARLTTASRRLTAERGLSGFTVEELCSEVGVSRRTFFNYFPSKEEAVLGVDEADEGQRLAERFLALGSRGWPAVIDDLVDLAREHVRTDDLGLAERADLHAAIMREPRLLARFLGQTQDRERGLIELVALREGVGTDDPRARTAVHIVFVLLRDASDRILAHGAVEEFDRALTASLDAARAVLAPSPSRKDTP